MSKQSDINTELKEVSAYPTKQEMNQKEVELLEQGSDGCCCSTSNASEQGQHQQG